MPARARVGELAAQEFADELPRAVFIVGKAADRGEGGDRFGERIRRQRAVAERSGRAERLADVEQCRAGITSRKGRGKRFDFEGVSAEGFERESGRPESGQVFRDPDGVPDRELDDFRDQQPLRGDGAGFHFAPQVFKEDPFRGRADIQQDEAVVALHQDPAVVEAADQLKGIFCGHRFFEIQPLLGRRPERHGLRHGGRRGDGALRDWLRRR